LAGRTDQAVLPFEYDDGVRVRDQRVQGAGAVGLDIMVAAAQKARGFARVRREAAGVWALAQRIQVDLMGHLRECRIPVESVHDGWKWVRGSMEITARLPPPDPAAKRDNGGLIVMVRHDSWKEGVASVVVCGDPRLAARAGVEPVAGPQRSAARLIADATGRRHHRSWTVDGWR
jgi:hypothetical protein